MKTSATSSAKTKKVAPKSAPQRKKGIAPKRVAHGAGVGKFYEGLILKGKSNEEVLEAVAKKFTGAHTSASSVSWYRTKLRASGKLH